MSRVRSVWCAGVVAGLLVGTGCGSDSGSGTSTSASRADKKVVAEYVDAMKASGGTEDFPVSDKDLECWMGGMVGGIGEKRLTEIGMSPDVMAESDSDESNDVLKKMTKKERTVFATSFKDCIDLKEVFLTSMEQEAEKSGEELPAAAKKCFESALSGDAIEEAFAEAIISGDESGMEDNAAFAPLMGCMFMSMGDSLGGSTDSDDGSGSSGSSDTGDSGDGESTDTTEG